MLIRGYVHDIQPNQASPTLELYFKERSAFPRGTRVPVTLELDGAHYSGTMNTANSNPPYLHTKLARSDGRRRTCTDVLLELELAENAELEFEISNKETYRLTRIINKGKWRLGNAPHERSVRTVASTLRSTEAAPQRTVIGIGSKFPFDNLAEILRYAELYWELITPAEAAEERAFEREMPAARQAGFLTKDLFVRLGCWKSVRQTPNYKSNDEQKVADATARAFAATDPRSAVSALMQLRGVALRTASALLQWMRPDVYCILDVRVVSALGKPEPASWDDVDFYLSIAADIRALARRHGLDLRTIDRALWAWDKMQSRRARGAC